MKEFYALRPKTYAYLIDGYDDDDDDDDYDKNKIINKKAKGTKKCVTKRKVIFENYTDCLMIKSYLNHNRDFKVIFIRCIQKKSIRLH